MTFSINVTDMFKVILLICSLLLCSIIRRRKLCALGFVPSFSRTVCLFVELYVRAPGVVECIIHISGSSGCCFCDEYLLRCVLEFLQALPPWI